MSTSIGRTEMPGMYEHLVQDRIRTLHREAERERLVTGLLRLRRARRYATRASARLTHAMHRLT